MNDENRSDEPMALAGSPVEREQCPAWVEGVLRAALDVHATGDWATVAQAAVVSASRESRTRAMVATLSRQIATLRAEKEKVEVRAAAWMADARMWEGQLVEAVGTINGLREIAKLRKQLRAKKRKGRRA